MFKEDIKEAGKYLSAVPVSLESIANELKQDARVYLDYTEL